MKLLYELNTDSKVAAISEKFLDKSIFLYALGSEENRTQYESAIKGTAGNGIFILNDELNLKMDNSGGIHIK